MYARLVLRRSSRQLPLLRAAAPSLRTSTPTCTRSLPGANCALERLNAQAGCRRAAHSDSSAADSWPEHEFIQVAENTLESISEQITELCYNSSKLSDFDVDLSQGVLTITLDTAGTYVLNTQTPNRQIWLSSPMSGPWRYDWNNAEQEWKSTRDAHNLSSRLSSELGVIFDKSVSVTVT